MENPFESNAWLSASPPVREATFNFKDGIHIQDKGNQSEPIVVRKSNKFVSRLPRLTMDKEGRLVLLTDNLKRFINNSKTLLFALFFRSARWFFSRI